MQKLADLGPELEGLVESSWAPFLAENFDIIRSCLQKVEDERTEGHVVFPPRGKLFEALRLTTLDSVCAAGVAQDPYPTAGQAHGLAFSVADGVKVPRSLKNIYAELAADVGLQAPTSGNLTGWAKQVLLLNTHLTVREGLPGSHAKFGWDRLTDALIRHISQRRSHVVFLLWGKHAHEKASLIDPSKHLVIKTSHPSPLGATKHGNDFVAFKGSRCFSATNEYLVAHGCGAVDWRTIES